MKDHKNISIKKSILIGINLIMVPILAITVLLSVLLLYQVNGDVTLLFSDHLYEESMVLKGDLQNQAIKLKEFIQVKEQLETEGKLDDQKWINVFDFYSGTYVPGQNRDSLCYQMKDLLNWMQNSSDYMESLNHGSHNYVGMPYKEVVWLKDFEREYKPKGYESIQDFTEKNGSNMQQCVEALMSTLYELPNKIGQYEELKDTYNPKNTNLVYEVTNQRTKEVFTNGTVTVTGKSMASFIGNEGIYTIRIGVNTAFPIKDSFYYANRSYNQYAPYAKLIFLGMILSFLVSVITLVWLTRLSGSRPGEKSGGLMMIDRLPTEVSIGLWMVIGSLTAYGLIASVQTLDMHDYSNTITIPATIIPAAFLANVLFLTGYLSLVRILKAKTFLRNSLCLRFYKLCRQSLLHTKGITKIILGCGGSLFAIFVFSLFYWWYGFGMAAAIICTGLLAVYWYKDMVMREKVLNGVGIITSGDLNYKIPVEEMNGFYKEFAQAINQIGDGLHHAVEDSMKNERTKTDLITNVSHDIKTPLTSIVNYVDLLKREHISDEKIKGYIQILDEKSQRLKQLTEDLVEASKISSGNITMELMNMDFKELLQQTIGEFEDKFHVRGLEILVEETQDAVVIEADGRRMWRVLENLFRNVEKYAMPNSRVYIALSIVESNMIFTVKNISESALNISAEELTERFIRGDISRSTEGSGLGLSIAKNLVTLQKGKFDIYLDGDLFKVTITFPVQSQ
ncbi:MAG: HAMP domain-containing sensor histidine kinase [Lachnospiraceae bacterium]